MKLATWFLFVGLAGSALGGTEGMQQMPMAREKKVMTVTGNENWGATKGFGSEAGDVRMMNLMMVEGSGMEGMDMGETKMEPSEKAKPDDHQP